MDSPLMIKSKAFALEVIKVCNEVKQAKRESVLTKLKRILIASIKTAKENK